MIHNYHSRLVFSLQLGEAEADKKSYQMLFPAHPWERGTVLAVNSSIQEELGNRRRIRG